MLNVEEHKKFAGHSKYSNVTPRCIHVEEKKAQIKIYRERGVEVKETEKVEEESLKIKVCPRCKHENSPTFRFCSMCSMPLDLKTMFEVQTKGEILSQGTYQTMIGNKGYEETMKAFLRLQQRNPQLFKRLTERFWQNVAIELLKEKQTIKV